MKRTLKRLLSFVLVAALFISSIPTQAFAVEETEVSLPEVELGEDILAHDVFYLATTGASIPENGNGVYLLRVGRGGPADSESSVLVKIADMTAKYGEDYIVRVRDERTRVENPEDNFSLMEMMEDSDFEQRTISDSDEFADMVENDAEAQEAYREGVNAALTYLEDASGLSEKYDGENPYAEAESGEDAESAGEAEPAEGETSDAEPAEGESDEPAGEAEPTEEEDAEPANGETTEPAGALDMAIEAVPAWDAGAIPADGRGELLTIGGGEETEDSLQKAVNLFTGRNATPQRLTSEGDMFQDLQAIADVMTNAVVGASVELTFQPGETEKYLEIVPKDNRTGDGDRMFYIILGAPSGTTTNSSASTCAFTIVDDEEQEPATVSFSDAVYYADGESITVTVERSGAMNTVVSAKVKTTGEGTAQAGRDYAEVDAELVFPFGVDHLTLDIPVRTAYLTGEGSFGLALEPTAGCETGETAAATVYLEGSYTGKASLMAAQSASPAEGELMAVSGTTTDRNNLATLKTLDNIDLSKPVKTYYTGMQSVNQYNSAGQWQMMYAHKDSAGKYGGKVESFFELTDDYWTSYFLSGAQVKWNRTYGGSDHALMRVALFGSRQTPNKTYPLASGWASSLSENTLFDAQLTEEVETESFWWPTWAMNHAVKWFPYSSDRDFTNETRYIYPSLAASDPSKQGRYATPEGSDIYAVRDAYWTALEKSAPTEPEIPQLTDLGGPALGGDHPQAIGFLNWGKCKDCNILYISSVAPVLRPFQVNVRDGDRLLFLLEDGSRGAISSDTSVFATLAEGGRQAVLFMDDSFTVNTVSGSNVGQYAYITGLNLLDGKDESKVLYTLATNNDPANTSITYTLSTGNMEQMIKTICPEYGKGETQNWFNLLRENTQVNEGQSKDGYATYALYNIKPTFDYMDASVTLRNPYNFPVTMVISGTQYKLNAREVRKINTPDGQSWHRGDTMAVSKIILSEDLLKSYTPVGVRYESKFRTTDALPNKGTLSFVAGNAVYVSGGIDGRLNYAEVIVEPNIQAKDNKIQVRVKNTELSKFLSDDDVKIVETPVLDEQGNPVLDENGKPLINREVETLGVAGVLGTKGRVDGDYTVFTYADTDKTVNGQLYAITATPKDSGMVCVWEDNNTLKTYEGNTFYFTAGEELARNQITLSAAPATAEVTLQGTLKYTSFNLRAGLAGIESNLPAAGAILAAGSAGGAANKDGYVTAGPIPCSGYPDHYLRYLVSVNGTDLVQETSLPTNFDAVFAPTFLCDFNSDNAMSSSMGWTKKTNIGYSGEKDALGNDYYNFTATNAGRDPEVSIDSANRQKPDDLRWVKIRARNLNGYVYMDLYVHEVAKTTQNKARIYLNSDTEWHEYIAAIPRNSENWPSLVNYLRLVPMSGKSITKGAKIQIDYIAFFRDETSAKAYTHSVVPTMLWDFNSDNEMSAHMGANLKNQVSYQGEKDSEGNDYYTFTATGNDPFVSIDNAAINDLNTIPWVKMRARNLSEAAKIEMFIGYGSVFALSNAQLDLKADTEWHEYIFNLQQLNAKTKGRNYWTHKCQWIRFDPMEGNTKSGSQIQIDYLAFFPDEDSAVAFRRRSVDSVTIDISSNFPTGVSPVTSSIFKDIQIDGTMNDSAYQIDGSTIPVVVGKTANMTVRVRAQKYVFSMTGQDGQDGQDLEIISDDLMETPVSVQLVVYDKNDVFRGEYELVDKFSKEGGYFVFDTPMEFVEPEELILLLDKDNKPVLDDAGNPVYVKMGEDGKPLLDGNGKPIPAEPTYGLIPEPGDKLYLRLTTDRLAQVDELRTKSDKVIDEYRYSDVFTGLTFRQPLSYAAPPKMGLQEPIEIEYGNLPLVGNTGMDLAFPFVSVGIMKIYQGYRVYIGVSPVQIADTIKGSHMSSMSGAGGQYWKDLFSIKHPFDTFFGGMSEAATQIGEIRDAAKAAKASKQSYSAADLGSPSWKFDISVGMYFDFTYCTIKQGQSVEAYYKFDGLGGYVSVTLGFSMAWYVILPVVFLPAYFGIELGGTVMGFLGADFNSEVDVDYDASMNGSANINDGITSLNGCIRGSAYVQISLGVGLCGTLGVRGSGKVNMIANWEPTDPNGSWGFYVGIQAGLIIDLFLFSIPLMYSFPGWPFGSFEYYSNPEKSTISTKGLQSASLMSASSTLRLREGSGEDSVWLGDQAQLMGAFAPNRDKTQILAQNAYERPDSQLITLSDGETLALAFIDSDNSKGVTQRTTLKLSIYDAETGTWSAPVPVANDDTADFQPSIAETKDGRLLVAWVSTNDASITDVSTDEEAVKYLDSMDVYAAFVELDGKAIRTREDNGVTVADTEVTRISNDRLRDYYDANPTVVCDMESGDAIVYYIKSDRVYVDGELGEYVNPYTNDSVVSYMIYSAEGVEVTKPKPSESGDEPVMETITEHWLFDYYYPGERDHNTAGVSEEDLVYVYSLLISIFGGQRFLDGPINDKNERYAIPDFTAVGYEGLSVCAYTVDPDGSSDTDADKELYLQVYDFRNHKTRYQTVLTDDETADTTPQLFRSRVNTEAGQSTEEENTHTKLFWYRNGKEVVYIDVTALLRDGINDDGTLKTETNGGEAETEYTYVLDGKTHYRYTDPRSVWFVSDTDSHASLSQPDFKAVEDSRGNLYILWTEGVTGEDGNAAQEIFGTGLVGHEITTTDGDGNAVTEWVSTGWSRPYQITRDGWNNDEIVVAMSGENLITVHNRFREELVELPEGTEYSGQVDFMPLTISEMCLVADTLEPCGSVETESITLYRVTAGTMTDEEGNEVETESRSPITRPVGGETVSIEVEVANNGMNTAEGYKLSLYAGDAPVGEIEVTDALTPNSTATHIFDYTLPSNVDGLAFRVVAQEMRDAAAGTYYADTDTYTSDPLKAEAAYAISEVETYQAEDGFHARFTVTNDGNAASGANDTLKIQLWGPANLANAYPDVQGSLSSEAMNLGIGETKEFDLPVSVSQEMIKEYGFVRARVAVQKEVVEQVINGNEYKGTRYLSNLRYTDFDLAAPMNMTLLDVNVAVHDSADISFAMELGELFRDGSSVTFAVDDLSVAKVAYGRIVGVSEGTTTLHATHAATGATVASTVTVTKSGAPTPTYSSNASSNTPSTAEIAVEVSSDDGSVSVTAKVSGNTAIVTAPTEAQMEQLLGRSKAGAVITDLSSLPKTVTSVTVPAGTIKVIDEAMEDSGEGLTIKLPHSTVTFDPEALASIAEQTTGKDLTLSVDPTTESKLNTKQKEALGDLDVQAVYDIYLTSDGKRITDFGGGKATVQVTYQVKDDQQPGGIELWYVPVEGGKTWIPKTATTDSVTFTVTHFSNYVLTYDETLPGVCAKDDACPMTPFTDLDKGSWYHDGVHWALENEVLSGYGGGKFGPDDATSRAMIVTMLYRMEDEPEVTSGMTFDDVPDGTWYTEAVTWAEANGIVNGVGNNKFAPAAALTREQLVTILQRYANYKGIDTSVGERKPLNRFIDAANVSEWAVRAMRWAADAGIINGVGNNTISPKAEANRVQVATMLMRYNSITQ